MIGIFLQDSQTRNNSTMLYELSILKGKVIVTTRTWHGVHEEFIFPSDLKEKLVDTFNEQVPEGEDFSCGYFEKPGNSKRWIESTEDLKAMYKTYRYENTINVWCDGRMEGAPEDSRAKRGNSGDSSDKPNSKRAKREEEIDSVFEQLRDRHSENYSDSQLRLWATTTI